MNTKEDVILKLRAVCQILYGAHLNSVTHFETNENNFQTIFKIVGTRLSNIIEDLELIDNASD